MTGTLVASTINAGASAALLLQSNSATALTLDTSQNVTAVGTVAMASSFKRNRIINGNVNVWQRGTSFSSVSYGTYTADRWASGAGTMTIIQNTDTPSGAFLYSIDCQQTSVDYNSIFQRIESRNSYDLSGQSVTISFWAKSVSGSSNMNVVLSYPTAVDNYTSITSIGSQNFTLTTSWVYYTLTFNALPSGVANGLQLALFRGNTSTSQMRITGVQLEVGTKATPYEMQIYSDQLAQCQRYYYKNGGSSAYQSHGVGSATATTYVDIDFTVPVVMRSAPTLTVNNLANMLLAPLTVTPSSVVMQDPPSTYSTHMLIRAITTGATVGSSQRLLSNNAATATLDFSAEL